MTLYRETPCEGCDVVGIYGGHVRNADNENGFERCPGSGGSREEVTIDYEAAWWHYFKLKPEGDAYQHFCNSVNVALGDTT